MSDLLPSRRKGGAPSKRTLEIERQILRALEDGMPITLVASAAGIAFETLCGWRRADEELDAAIKAAIGRGIAARLDVVRECMNSKDEAIRLRAATWWLSHAPESARYFSESARVEVSGLEGAQIAVLVWPHQQQLPTSNETASPNDCPSETPPSAD